MGCKDIGIRKSEFVVKTQFLCLTIIDSLDPGRMNVFWR